MCEERSYELKGCERSEHKVEDLFLNILIGMLLSLRFKMPSLCKKAVQCFCCRFAPAFAPRPFSPAQERLPGVQHIVVRDQFLRHTFDAQHVDYQRGVVGADSYLMLPNQVQNPSKNLPNVDVVTVTPAPLLKEVLHVHHKVVVLCNNTPKGQDSLGGLVGVRCCNERSESRKGLG